MQYDVKITETLQRIIAVTAASAEDAEAKVYELWKDSNIVLDAQDFVDVDISVIKTEYQKKRSLWQRVKEFLRDSWEYYKTHSYSGYAD